MNASFEPLHLVNTYGAFGAVTRERLEVVIKGTDAEFADGFSGMARIRVQGKTRRREPSALHRLAVSLEARLANVVRCHVAP